MDWVESLRLANNRASKYYNRLRKAQKRNEEMKNVIGFFLETSCIESEGNGWYEITAHEEELSALRKLLED